MTEEQFDHLRRHAENYGMGPAKLGDLIADTDLSKRKRQFEEMYPQVVAWHKELITLVDQG